MDLTGTEALRHELRRWLRDEGEPIRQRLLSLIRAIDLAPRKDNDAEGLVQLVLARAVIAIAPLFAPPGEAADPAIEATTRAARAYLELPTHERWAAFEQAATSSYPFGPGDGCLAVDELGGCNAPGAGDRGAGFIWEAALHAGPERVYTALRRELMPMLVEPTTD